MVFTRDARAVYELVTRLGAIKGWTSHAEIHRQTGVAASTLARWKQGGGGRTDWFQRFEEKYPLPDGLLLDVYEGRLTPDEVVAKYRPEVARETPTQSDFRTGPDADLDRARDLEGHAAMSAVLVEALESAKTVGKSIGKLGLTDHDITTVQPKPEFLVDDAHGRLTVIDLTGPKWDPEGGPKIIQQLVGRQAMWRRRGVERVILFTVVDWPWEPIDQLAEYGIEYAAAQERLEQLLLEGAQAGADPHPF